MLARPPNVLAGLKVYERQKRQQEEAKKTRAAKEARGESVEAVSQATAAPPGPGSPLSSRPAPASTKQPPPKPTVGANSFTSLAVLKRASDGQSLAQYTTPSSRSKPDPKSLGGGGGGGGGGPRYRLLPLLQPSQRPWRGAFARCPVRRPVLAPPLDYASTHTGASATPVPLQESF